MNFIADENIDLPIVARLRSDGHLVYYVAEEAASSDDHEVMNRVNEQGALLLTADKDFGELVFRQRLCTTGVVLIRMLGLSPSLKAELVGSTIQARGDEMPGRFTVIAPGNVRIRHAL